MEIKPPKKNILLNPGPTNVSTSVKKALISDDMNHRESAFTTIMHKLLQNILYLSGGEETHSCIPFVSSGTGAIESILCSLKSDSNLLVLDSGRYGKRIYEIAEQIGLKAQSIYFDPMKGINTDCVKDFLKYNQNITHIAFTHHETTTSILSPIDEISKIAHEFGVKTIVDTISSLFGELFSLKKTNIDFCTLSSNKCLEGVPGLSFVIAKNSLLSDIDNKSRSYYFDLYEQWNRIINNDGLPRFTMATNIFASTLLASERLIEEGVENRHYRYVGLKTYLRKKMESLGFIPFNFSNLRTSSFLQLYHIDRDINFEKMHSRCIDECITIYSSKEMIKNGYFYLATLGDLSYSDIDKFINVLASLRKTDD